MIPIFSKMSNRCTGVHLVFLLIILNGLKVFLKIGLALILIIKLVIKQRQNSDPLVLTDMFD